MPVLAVSGGQVFLEVTVTAAGRVGTIKLLRTTPPFTEGVVAAVRTWQFRPAQRIIDPPVGLRVPAIEPVESHVLVAAVIRPPVLFGPTIGVPPEDVATASTDTPFPLSVTTPTYPPLAINDGTVVVDATIDAGGGVTETALLRSSPAFDDAAREAARTWSFTPVRLPGTPVARHAFLIFVFRQPITSEKPPASRPPTTPTPAAPPTR